MSDPVAVFALATFLVLLAPIVMGRWQLPGTIGLLLAGVVRGPNALGILARDQSFALFGTVGCSTSCSPLRLRSTWWCSGDRSIQFTGEAIFVPFSLLSVGMPLDVQGFLSTRRAWQVSAAMLITVASTKWLAAPISSKILGYNHAQARVVFGLSLAQATDSAP